MAEGSPEGSEWFWNTVDETRGDRANLATAMADWPKEDIARFAHEFHELYNELDHISESEHYADATEDELSDVAQWAVSQGRDFYRSVLRDPTLIPSDVTAHVGWLNRSLSGVADNVYWARFNEELPWPEEFLG